MVVRRQLTRRDKILAARLPDQVEEIAIITAGRRTGKPLNYAARPRMPLGSLATS
jgi:hypothetical protein